MAPPRTPLILIAAGVLCTAVACGVPAREGAAVMGAAVTPADTPAAQAGSDLVFGSGHRFASGVSFSVAAPKSFQPSSAAYPPSPRGAAFEIEVVNNGVETYRLSGLAVTATIAGAPAKQVVDATQGFTGVSDAGKDVLPGRSTRITLAFAVPSEAVRMRLQLRPSATDPAAATYCGPA
ncbi:hypothetical protein [Amycolatopsis samaneae]|uniref:DUF4352 domain-containing protein n=1 Tax=Amycolatopsis samaneae TaxID=664691 RepID=A0ABW5GLU9_9PSEU